MQAQNITDIIIIGAGISGLATAHFLSRQGMRVTILEKQARTGGSIRSERKDGFLIDYGPNSALDTTPFIHELFTDLGIEEEMEYANEKSNNRYILRDGRLNALPMSPIAFLRTPHFSARAKLRLLKEPFICSADPEADESLAEFVQRRLGPEFLDYAIDPFVAGVYAGKPDHLSVKSGFPKLYALEQNYGSLIKGAIMGARERRKRKEVSKQSAKLFSFPDGMQTVIDALHRKFKNSLYLKSELQYIRREGGLYQVTVNQYGKRIEFQARNLLLTVPSHQYSGLPAELFSPLLPVLEQIYYPPVSMVFFGYRDNPANRPLDGFGFLIPSKENRQILGTIWSSTIFSRRAPAGGTALTTFVGGSRQPEKAQLPEAEQVELVKSDLADLLGIKRQPDLVEIKAWSKAIPQYKVGHEQIISKIEQFEDENPGLYLSGNFRGGISVADCIKQAKAMTERIESRTNVKNDETVVTV